MVLATVNIRPRKPVKLPILIVVVGSLAFGGCSAHLDGWHNQYLSDKGFISSSVIEHDMADCQTVTDKARSDNAIQDYQMSEYMRQCMRGKGYNSHAI